MISKMSVPFLLFPLDEDSNQERNDLLNECSGRWGHRPGWGAVKIIAQ